MIYKNPRVIKQTTYTMANVKAEVKGDNLIITLPWDKNGYLSPSKKNQVHASSKGNVETDLDVNGKKLIVGVNAYVPVPKS